MVVVLVLVVVGGGGVILGEVKARPKDIISFSLDYISKSKVQTSSPSSSPIPLDTPARPADCSTDPCFPPLIEDFVYPDHVDMFDIYIYIYMCVMICFCSIFFVHVFMIYI